MKHRLRRWAKGKHCTVRIDPGIVCQGGTETVVLAHAPKGLRYGKGLSLKPSDFLAALACSRCHDVLDRRVKSHYSDQDLKLMFFEGMAETLVLAEEDNVILINE